VHSSVSIAGPPSETGLFERYGCGNNAQRAAGTIASIAQPMMRWSCRVLDAFDGFGRH
jgi:hypothetical protein